MSEHDALKEKWAMVMALWMIEILQGDLSIRERMKQIGIVRDALLEGLDAYLELANSAVGDHNSRRFLNGAKRLQPFQR